MLSIRKPGVPSNTIWYRDGDCSDGAGSRCLGYWLDGLGPEKAKEVVRREGLAVYMTPKRAIILKPGCRRSLKASLQRKKLKRKIVGFCVMVTGQTKAILNQGADYEKRHMLN